MAEEFPSGDVDVILEAAFGADLTADPSTWVFTDLSSRVVANPITISQGVVVGAGTTRTGSASGIVCTNDDGWLTPFLETSPYWPYVDAGTPARLSIRTAQADYFTDTFERTVAAGSWGRADTGQAWTTGISSLSVSGGKGLMSIAATGTVINPRFAEAHRDVDVTFDVSIPAVTTGTFPNSFGVQLHRTTAGTSYLLALIDFKPGGAIGWSTYSSVLSSITFLPTATQPGLTYTAGTVIRGRVELINGRLRCRAWLASGTEPTTWAIDTIVPANVAAATNLSAYGWVQPGVTNTMPMVFSVDNFSVKAPKMIRVESYLTGVQPSFWVDSSGTPRSTVQITLAGIGSRLEKLKADELSPLRRSIQKAATPPIAYWPLEDKSGAVSGASAYPDQPPMVITGPAVFAFDLNETDDNYIPRYGLTSIVSLAAGAKMAAAAPQTAATAWTVAMEHQSNASAIGGGVTSVRLMEWQTPSSTINRWALIAGTSGYIVRAYNDAAGTTTDVITYNSAVFPYLNNYAIQAVQNGGNIDVTWRVNAVNFGTGSIAGTIGGFAPTRVSLNPDQVNTTASVDPFGIRFLVGHVAVYASSVIALPFYTDGTLGVTARSDRGWAYEAAHRRGVRLAAEERIPFTVLGAPYTSGVTQLNAQPSGTFQDLMKRTFDSESGGLLYEGGFGYVHDPRTNRYNRAVSLTVDMSTYRYMSGTDPKSVLVPSLDPRGPNTWTVERANGSAATYAAPAAYRQRRGDVADKAELDILYDSDCAPHAQWRTHLSVDGSGANYPNLTVDLAANPGLIDDWLTCTIGSRMQRTNQPTIAGVGTIDQIIDGMSETITPRQAGGPGWTATTDASPASVWQTGIWDSATSLWQPANTTPSSTVNTTATSWSMNSNGEAWITGAVSLRAKLGPEQVLITNITGAGSAWTFTVTRSVNGVVASHAIGAEAIVLLDTGTWGL